jgi:hypothetical protein
LDNAQARSDISTYFCSIGESLLHGYGFIRASIAYTIAGSKAKTSSGNFYDGMGEHNTRRDAFRHILWNAWLAKYYFTISSKSRRIGFAKLITDARENFCADPNDDDGKEMDFHNNFIGRKIWDDKTTYRRLFGFIVGLRMPSDARLKKIAKHTVDKVSCYIVKEENPILSSHYSIEETKQEILKIHQNTAVYFSGPIADKQSRTTVTNDHSECIGSSGANELIVMGSLTEADVAPNAPCIRKIYTTTLINSCFVSRDINFVPNPD